MKTVTMLVYHSLPPFSVTIITTVVMFSVGIKASSNVWVQCESQLLCRTHPIIKVEGFLNRIEMQRRPMIFK